MIKNTSFARDLGSWKLLRNIHGNGYLAIGPDNKGRFVGRLGSLHAVGNGFNIHRHSYFSTWNFTLSTVLSLFITFCFFARYKKWEPFPDSPHSCEKIFVETRKQILLREPYQNRASRMCSPSDSGILLGIYHWNQVWRTARNLSSSHPYFITPLPLRQPLPSTFIHSRWSFYRFFLPQMYGTVYPPKSWNIAYSPLPVIRNLTKKMIIYNWQLTTGNRPPSVAPAVRGSHLHHNTKHRPPSVAVIPTPCNWSPRACRFWLYWGWR